jgi:tRNA dimethylallyltransferase
MAANHHEPPLVVCLMGPTASGKSLLAMEVAKRIPVEIVSVDSAQVYRGMNLGTAKPSVEERGSVPHHLIDLIEPTERYSAARFREDALRVINDIVSRGRLPLLVGGTMLYFRALLEGLSPLPQADPGIRADIELQARERGWASLHEDLARVDPLTASRIKRGDPQRIQRALEIFRLTGSPPSQLMQASEEQQPPVRALRFALAPVADRSELHHRIAVRFESMLEAGLVEELRMLKSQHPLAPEMPSMRCVGYRQAWQYLEGDINRAELRDHGVYATRQLAKRQITWLRSTPDTRLFDLANANTVASMAQSLIETIGHTVPAQKNALTLG